MHDEQHLRVRYLEVITELLAGPLSDDQRALLHELDDLSCDRAIAAQRSPGMWLADWAAGVSQAPMLSVGIGGPALN